MLVFQDTVMNSKIKNLAIASTVIFIPLKSERAVSVAKPVVQNIPKCEYFVDFAKNENKQLVDFMNAPLERLHRLDSINRIVVAQVPQPKKDLDVAKTKFVGHPDFLNMFLLIA